MTLGRIGTSAMVVIVLFVALACSSESVKDGRYYNKGEGFSIEFPEWWKRTEHPMAIVAMTNPSDAAGIGVNCYSVPEGVTLKQLKQRAQTNTATIGATVIASGEMTIDGHDAYWLTVSAPGETDMTVMHCGTMRENRSYVVVCTAPAQEFADYEDLFTEVAESFRFED